MWGSNRYGNDKADLINDKFKSQIKNESIKVFRSDSITAAENFQTSYFDFIYIDTDHSYETTIKELRAWKTKIKDDGIIAGHDYMMGNWLKTLRYGVIEAVHQFCIEDNWQLIYLTADQTENLSFAIKRI
jgi:predicted O-methyltransferase YrrM